MFEVVWNVWMFECLCPSIAGLRRFYLYQEFHKRSYKRFWLQVKICKQGPLYQDSKDANDYLFSQFWKKQMGKPFWYSFVSVPAQWSLVQVRVRNGKVRDSLKTHLLCDSDATTPQLFKKIWNSVLNVVTKWSR
jgi:hypothetical protein